MLLAKIFKAGLIVDIPNSSVGTAVKRIRALVDGGIRLIGIDMRQAEAFQIVERCAAQFADQVAVNAQYVLDSASARKSILAGADMVSTPCLIKEVLTLCHRYGKICIPGALTATEVLQAIEWGADLVMIYPADLFGPGLLKAFKSPLPQAHLIPSAGVNSENMAAWLRAGACAVMVEDLFREAKEKDPSVSDDKITMYARKLTHCFANTAASLPSRSWTQ